ncbi:unnamed protein product [Paramecium pentaurelia]|uniref:Uncharacterized protein n=1 Tax=Paramecium pentaurelia TaxID=43138 RepID=A0A8S1X618_9CILI|nr:unnamed protein product [Paramecium pentaurelia]
MSDQERNASFIKEKIFNTSRQLMKQKRLQKVLFLTLLKKMQCQKKLKKMLLILIQMFLIFHTIDQIDVENY